tara:strand:+ start:2081 stop:3313 length:1233 start_codon:yes stop_codon:yes gene_type:complete
MNTEQFKKLLEFTSPINECFKSDGKKIYLVGGIVRDIYAGLNDTFHLDLDFTTDATPDEIKTIIQPVAESVWLSGQQFGTIGAQINGKTIEITTHRSESYVSKSRKPVVTFSTDLYEDLSRRDFTINSMAINLESGKLIDPFNGLRDLQIKILRTPLDPHISFSEDPLRMMRAARFISLFNLTLEKGIKESVSELKDRLAIVSNERIRDELNKLLITPDPNPGFKFLLKTKLYESFFPELNSSRRQHQIRYLRHDHCIRLAALLINSASETRKDRLKYLKYSNREIDTIDNLISASQMILTQPMSNPQYRKWYLHAGENRQGSIDIASIQRGVRKKIAAIQRQSRHLDQELEDYIPPFTGSEIISILEMPQGPEIGEVLQLLENMFIESGPVSNQEALNFLAEWIKAKDN